MSLHFGFGLMHFAVSCLLYHFYKIYNIFVNIDLEKECIITQIYAFVEVLPKKSLTKICIIIFYVNKLNSWLLDKKNAYVLQSIVFINIDSIDQLYIHIFILKEKAPKCAFYISKTKI